MKTKFKPREVICTVSFAYDYSEMLAQKEEEEGHRMLGTKITFMNGRDWISSSYVGEKVTYLGVSMVVIKRHCLPTPSIELPKEEYREAIRYHESPFVICEFVDGHGHFQTKKFSGDEAMLLEGHGILRKTAPTA